MSTDDEMDVLLHEAGARWRATNPGSTPTVDFAAMAPTDNKPGRNRWLVAAAAAVVVAAVAVGGTWLGTRGNHSNRTAAAPVGDRGGLIGTKWQLLMSSSTDPKYEDAGATGYPTLHLSADGTLLADDGCNSINGPSTIGGSTIQFGSLFTSAVGCFGPNGERAALIDSVLTGKVTWSTETSGTGQFTESRLTITKAGKGTLVYVGSPAPKPPITDPNKMPGTWQLIELDQTSGTSQSSRSTYNELLVVDADGTFKVQNRCYANAGRVAIAEGSAAWTSVHPAGSMPCPATQTQQDEQTVNDAVDSVLKGETTWAITDTGDLTITKGGTKLIYAPYASGATPSGTATK